MKRLAAGSKLGTAFAPALALSFVLLASCAAPATPNRDVHGGRDVGRYVRSLESDRRIAEMRPDFVVESIGLAQDDVVADLGCGPGVFSLRFAEAVPLGFVLAVDVEPRQLDRLREHLLRESVANVVPVLCSPTTPHLPPRSCDVIFVADTYHHIENRVEYMRRLAGALAPGGRLVIFEYKPGDLPVGPPAAHKLEPGELTTELTEAGYELVTDFRSHEYHDFQIWKPRP